MGPGQAGEAHSHDLGHEVFLVLRGTARIDIEDEAREFEAGQMCLAVANQVHSVRAVGEQPLLMYLSVTPHIQPTHMWWGQPDARLPHRFLPSSAYDVEGRNSAWAGYDPQKLGGDKGRERLRHTSRCGQRRSRPHGGGV